MGHFFWSHRKETPVKGVTSSSAKGEPKHVQSDEVSAALPMPPTGGYELFQFAESNGTVVAARHTLASWQASDEDYLTPAHSRSPAESFKTVISRTHSGTFVRVQRPIRKPATSRVSSRLSASSSVYSERPQRDTMESTMTIVEDALAELRFSQTQRHSRRDGPANTIAPGDAVSGISGDIPIGQNNEVDESVLEGLPIAVFSDQAQIDDRQEPQTAYDADETGLRQSYISCDLIGSKAVAPPHQVYDAQKLTSKYTAYSRQSIESWGQEARERAEEQRAIRFPLSPMSSKTVWIRRLVSASSYFMAICSVILPALFLVLGVSVALMNREPVSSKWSTMSGLLGMAAAMWPVAFAAVVAQCYKVRVFYQTSRGSAEQVRARYSDKHWLPTQRQEVNCLFVFLVWSFSTFGSQALAHVYGSIAEAHQDQINLWYIDQTGNNSMWSANSSAASRQDLVQLVSERYIGSLSLGPSTTASNDSTTSFSSPWYILSGPAPSATDSLESLPIRSIEGRSSLDKAAAVDPRILSFTMTTSYFDLICGNWTTMMRHFEDLTAGDGMSYSAGQTLGLRMTAGQDSNVGTIQFASLNSRADDTALVRSDRNGTYQNTTLEYSIIRCNYQQRFYSVPVKCDPSQGACFQSAEEGLVLASLGTSGGQLTDFAQDFVAANIASPAHTVTATEYYIGKGGLADRISSIGSTNHNASFNLSAMITSGRFAQRFGHLFNNWVSLGYCPECTSDVLAGNNTVIPSNLQSAYHKVMATRSRLGDEVYTVDWAWLAVFLFFATVLLIAGVTSVAIESVVSMKQPCEQNETALWSRDGDDLRALRLAKTCSGATSGQRSNQWATDVMLDMEAIGHRADV